MSKRSGLIIAGLLLVGTSSIAEAGRSRSGGGRVGRTSSGMRSASSGSHGSTGSSGGSSSGGSRSHYGSHTTGWQPSLVTYPGIIGTGVGPQPTASFELYGGMQKLYESDFALSLETSLQVGPVRLNGAWTSYRERLYGDEWLSVEAPSITLGARVTDNGPTRLFVEGGAAWLMTNNAPVMNTTLAGVTAGGRLEQVLSRNTALLADARVMAFQDDVRATEARLGVQVSYLRASFRMLDTNVGPALFGPEVGVGVRF